MNRYRTITRLLAVVAAAALGRGCGDGGDGPTSPPAPELGRPATVTVSPATAELPALGATIQLTAEVRDQNGRVMGGAAVTWSSSDGSVATVNATGLVTGVAVGIATITASAGSGRGTAEITVMDQDRAALVALYEATDGPNWVNNENWLTDAPLGEWFGIDTDASGRVVRLAMTYLDPQSREWTSNNVSGPIPAELGGLSSLTNLRMNGNHLSGPIPPELGRLSNLRGLYLDNNDLTGPIPAELGNLESLTSLWLQSNSLTGPIPSGLGSLASLQALTLGGNDLTGPIPDSFLDLNALERFSFVRNAGLCAPGTIDFVNWLEGIEDAAGPYCNEADAGVLDRLYQAAGGPNWTNSSGWLATPALQEWYGVTANALGQVVALDLTRNALTGTLTASLGSLAQMTALRVGSNALSGRLPLALADLSLVEFDYADTGLCVPAEASFQAWLNGISSHEGTDAECAPLSDREILEILYHATGGPNWTRADYWLTDAPTGQWWGVRTDSDGRVVRLELFGNNLTGSIPPEIGMLSSLERLNLGANGLTGPIPPHIGDLGSLTHLELDYNDHTGTIPRELGDLTDLEVLTFLQNGRLTGSIPPELGNLTRLKQLRLAFTDLTGPMPPELGRLSELTYLYVWRTRVAGPIPPEFGNLVSLTSLALGENELTGPIPPELGNLRNLERLTLVRNAMTGPIPAELGRLSNLEVLSLDQNSLTGTIPGELGQLTNLKELGVANNTGLSGALPTSLTALSQLGAFVTTGTALCAPSDPSFQTWLRGIVKRRVAPCATGNPAEAYLTQTVQSRMFPVPLVAGERALLRVFVTATRTTGAGIPATRARFFLDGRETHVVDIPGTSTPIPIELDEGDLSKSANAEIPGHIMQPGLEMVIEVDPEGTLDPGLGVAKRIPETGRRTVEVYAMPTLDLTVVPFVWTVDPDSDIVDIAGRMAADPENHEMLWATRTLLPVGNLHVTAHETVQSTTNNAGALAREAAAIRLLEGGTGHYMAMMSGDVVGPRGLAIGNRVTFTRPYPTTIAHELGHNMSLNHAPCGGAAGLDRAYPYSNGTIGSWGYEFLDGGRLVNPSRADLMAYCRPRWISDYHFTNALRFRLVDEENALVAQNARRTKALLLWGGMDADSVPFLEPAFVVDAPPALPPSGGQYDLTGRSADGTELFFLSFEMAEVADGDGGSSFTFVLPTRPEWESNIASITLSGPAGSVTLDQESNLPMAILRNPRTNQIRGMLRDLPSTTHAAGTQAVRSAGSDLGVLFSRGVPDAAAWDP